MVNRFIGRIDEFHGTKNSSHNHLGDIKAQRLETFPNSFGFLYDFQKHFNKSETEIAS